MTEETKPFEPVIIGFTCNWCSYRAADMAGTARIKYAPNIRLIRLMCSGRLDPTFVFKAFAGARTERDQNLGFLAQQLGDMFVLVVAHPAVEQAQGDLAVLHGFHVFVLGIHGNRPEDHVEGGVNVQNFLVDVQNGDLAPAAGCGPVHGEFRFAHAVTSSMMGVLTCSPGCDQLSGPRARTSSTNLLISAAKKAPSAALAHINFRRPGSMPIWTSTRFSRWKRRMAL